MAQGTWKQEFFWMEQFPREDQQLQFDLQKLYKSQESLLKQNVGLVRWCISKAVAAIMVWHPFF